MTRAWARLLLACVVVAAPFAWGAAPAAACSCASSDTRRALQGADGAFVGTMVGSRPAAPTTPAPGEPIRLDQTIYSFDVDKAVKGAFPDGQVDVRSNSQTEACGLSAGTDEPVGLLLTRRDNTWYSDLCSQVSPEALERAASPLPEPTGTLPPAIVVGSTYGLARSVALDDKGRIAGLGAGTGLTTDIALCPEGTAIVELFTRSTPEGDVPGMTPRRLSDMKAQAEFMFDDWARPADSPPDTAPQAGPVACANADGTDVLLFMANAPEPGQASIKRIENGITTDAWLGPVPTSVSFAPDGSAAYLSIADGDALALRRVTLGDGVAESPVTHVPAGTGPVVVSPDGRLLTALVTGEGAPSRVLLIDAATGATGSVTLDTEAAGNLLWTDDKRIVFAPTLNTSAAVRVFDTALRPLATWSGWDAERAAVRGDDLIGARRGQVISAPLMTGEPVNLAGLEDALVVDMVTIPGPDTDPSGDAGRAGTGTEPEEGRSTPPPDPSTTTTTTAPTTVEEPEAGTTATTTDPDASVPPAEPPAAPTGPPDGGGEEHPDEASAGPRPSPDGGDTGRSAGAWAVALSFAGLLAGAVALARQRASAKPA